MISYPKIQMGEPCRCIAREQMLPCQVSLILLGKPQEAGCRQIISPAGRGERQPTLCAHRGDMALGHTEEKVTRACLEVQISGTWLLPTSTSVQNSSHCAFVVELIIEPFAFPF